MFNENKNDCVCFFLCAILKYQKMNKKELVEHLLITREADYNEHHYTNTKFCSENIVSHSQISKRGECLNRTNSNNIGTNNRNVKSKT